MSETTFAQTEGKRYSCPLCGGGLQYDIASGKMKCDHCGSLTELSQIPSEPAADTTMEVTEFRCPQCGAAVYSSATSVTSFCSFCGSDVVLTAKLTRTRRPARIVPFAVTREQCEQNYRKHLGKYHLVPTSLKTAETISHFRAVYVPFWSYHVRSEGPIELSATKSYTRGDTRYDETYKLDIDAVIDQKNILYDASSAFEDETAAMLRHTADNAKPFDPAYLSGFFAQAADVAPEVYYPEAAATAVRLFIDKVKEANKFDTVETKADAQHNFGLPEPRYEQELIMLPVWLLAHRQFGRVVYTAINGCTGDVVCDVPVSLPRVAAVAASLTVGIFVLLYLFLTIKPALLMALCALLMLITQFRFSGMRELLYNRKTRAFEPKRSTKEKTFIGPAQLLLQKGSTSGTMDLVKKYGVRVIGVVFFVLCAVGYESIGTILSSFSVGASFGSEVLPIAIMGILLLIMIIHTARCAAKPGFGSVVPRVVNCLICAAGLVSLLTKQAEDMVFYGCAVAMLAAAIWELAVTIRAHNEYASRPVPYFDGKGEAV